jgi:DUF1680 family protein
MTDYPIRAIPPTDVTIHDDFWSPRLVTNRTVTIPYVLGQCEATGRINNFRKAAGRMAGDHEGLFFNDSDVFKVMEGAALSLATHSDPALDRTLDDLIETIGAAQEADGYLYTARTIRERNGQPDRLDPAREGRTRWSNLRVNHELYNVGHLYEAAAAHFGATGKRSLLEIAVKNANLITATFGPGKRRDIPGHQEIEIGLLKLYRVTGEAEYLRLARFFLAERGRYHDREPYANYYNPGYMQDHLPVTEQAEAVGHAVRGLYMYAAMVDVAALTGDPASDAALDRLWRNVTARKLYLTGGVGAREHGEAFGGDYELPNAAAYAETCAAIANIFWNQRMFLLHGDAKYMDILERTLYNGFLSGVGMDGTTFFYANPLASDGSTMFNAGRAATRLPWFDCACCPTNVVRLLAGLPGYVYATDADKFYVNLFMGSEGRGEITDENGQTLAVTLDQRTRYPWHGAVVLTVQPARPARFRLCLRIPGWAQGKPVPSELYRDDHTRVRPVDIRLNGQPLSYETELGYVVITRRWQPGDRITFTLPMVVRRVTAHPNVRENIDQVALEYGPLVYCVEGADNGGSVESVTAPTSPVASTAYEIGDRAVTALRWPAGGRIVTAIPYFAWSERGPGEMRVWLPEG